MKFQIVQYVFCCLFVDFCQILITLLPRLQVSTKHRYQNDRPILCCVFWVYVMSFPVSNLVVPRLRVIMLPWLGMLTDVDNHQKINLVDTNIFRVPVILICLAGELLDKTSDGF